MNKKTCSVVNNKNIDLATQPLPVLAGQRMSRVRFPLGTSYNVFILSEWPRIKEQY